MSASVVFVSQTGRVQGWREGGEEHAGNGHDPAVWSGRYLAKRYLDGIRDGTGWRLV